MKTRRRQLSNLRAATWYDDINIPQSAVSNTTAYFDDSRDDGVRVANWRTKVKRHQDATSVLSGERYEVERKPVTVAYQISYRATPTSNWIPRITRFRGYPSNITLVTGTIQGGSADLGKADAHATRNFFRKAKECRQNMQSLVFLGELREAVRMVRNPAKALFDSARRDYLGRLKGLKASRRNWQDGITGAWLEWTFGVRPLVSDLQSAYDAYERLYDEGTRYRMIVASGYDTVQNKSPSVTTGSTSLGDRTIFTGLSTQTSLAKVRYKATYERALDSDWNRPSAAKAKELFGFSWSEFVPTVWELLPWSFLVDYFTNVGDVLEASFVTTDDIKCRRRTARSYSEYKNTCLFDDVKTSAANSSVWYRRYDSPILTDDGFYKVRRVFFQRTAVGPTVPSLTLELPPLGCKWLNMAALFSQATSIHPQRYHYRR